MDAEKYRVFMAVAAVATVLTFLVKFGPDLNALPAAWGAATQHPWLAVGLTLVVVAGLTYGVARWLDER
jgi:succinate dehydrogenase hydrophobic anchor subunit